MLLLVGVGWVGLGWVVFVAKEGWESVLRERG